MIRINLARGKSNNWSQAHAEMLMAKKFESLGYMDNPHEMNCGIRRCEYVQENWDKYHDIDLTSWPEKSL